MYYRLFSNPELGLKGPTVLGESKRIANIGSMLDNCVHPAWVSFFSSDFTQQHDDQRNGLL